MGDHIWRFSKHGGDYYAAGGPDTDGWDIHNSPRWIWHCNIVWEDLRHWCLKHRPLHQTQRPRQMERLHRHDLYLPPFLSYYILVLILLFAFEDKYFFWWGEAYPFCVNIDIHVFIFIWVVLFKLCLSANVWAYGYYLYIIPKWFWPFRKISIFSQIFATPCMCLNVIVY